MLHQGHEIDQGLGHRQIFERGDRLSEFIENRLRQVLVNVLPATVGSGQSPCFQKQHAATLNEPEGRPELVAQQVLGT